jgi:DNA-binding transcriptional LysR family regulator
MTDLDLTTLRLFIAVCDSRSIARIAERERLDASAITRRINKLENQAGKKLIKRIRNGVEPTSEGLQFCELSRAFVRDAARLSETLALLQKSNSARLLIATTSHAVAGPLPDDLSQFMSLSDAENLSVAVQEMSSSEVIQVVRDGRCAIGIYWDYVETTGLQTAHYYSDAFCCVVAAEHPLAGATHVSYNDVSKHKIIGMRTTRQAEAYVSRVGAIDAPKARYIVETSTHESALRLVAKNAGVFITSMSVFESYKHCWNLAAIPISNLFPLQFRLVFRNPESLPQSGQNLIKHLSSVHVNQQ